MEGRGIFTWTDGRQYQGDYKNDKKLNLMYESENELLSTTRSHNSNSEVRNLNDAYGIILADNIGYDKDIINHAMYYNELYEDFYSNNLSF